MILSLLAPDKLYFRMLGGITYRGDHCTGVCNLWGARGSKKDAGSLEKDICSFLNGKMVGLTSFRQVGFILIRGKYLEYVTGRDDLHDT